MAEKKKFLNLYTFSFKVDGVEYGQWLESVKIKKNVTKNHFVEDMYVFHKDAFDLLNLMLQEATVEIYLNKSGSYEKIFSITGMINKSYYKDDKIIVFFESLPKLTWIRKNGVSLTCEKCKSYDAVVKYVKKIDEFYKHKKETKVFVNYMDNLNDFEYENIIFPIRENHFDVLMNFANTYYIVNAPFFIYLDDYNFDLDHPLSLNIYDFTNIASLRAVQVDDLNTSAKPLLKDVGVFNDAKAFYRINKVQRFYLLEENYTRLKYAFEWNPENRFIYTVAPESSALSSYFRSTNAKTLFSKSSHYYEYELRDFDIRKLLAGYRYVDSTQNIKMQYTQCIADIEIRFLTVGSQNAIEKGKDSNELFTYGRFKTISHDDVTKEYF